MGSVAPGVSGERLVNFDINVVAQNNGAPISYNRGSNTCTLTCHQTTHNADGSISSGHKFRRSKYNARKKVTLFLT